jgi:hypothetical protein
VQKSSNLTPSIRNQILGEAKFVRAFIFYYLVNLYGDIPLAISTDWAINSSLPRAPKAQVYAQIVSDLLDAQSLLNENYLDGTLLKITKDRLRPTKWAAAALLARIYLFMGDYANAELQASIIINNSSLYSLPNLNSTFLKNSNEAIWQLQPTVASHNTEDAWIFIIPPTGLTDVAGSSSGYPVYLSNYLLNSFEIGDMRKNLWIDSTVINTTTYYYPFKYKSATLDAPLTEYLMVLRVGEQYLIRSEARAQQNNLGGAIADLDKIRQRAQLPLVANTNPGISKADLLNKILHERQVELFSEWGHRWLDLKRTDVIDAVMKTVTVLKGGEWNSYKQFYPILVTDIQKDANLNQNPGY